jgi:hypothetical protein
VVVSQNGRITCEALDNAFLNIYFWSLIIKRTHGIEIN